jgi:hypothetical protein
MVFGCSLTRSPACLTSPVTLTYLRIGSTSRCSASVWLRTNNATPVQRRLPPDRPTSGVPSAPVSRAFVSSRSETYGGSWCIFRKQARPVVRHTEPDDSLRRMEGLRFKPDDRTTGAVASLRAVAEVIQADLVSFCEQRLLPEVQLFFAAGRMLTRTRLNLRPRLPWLLETTVLESFALHARALIDFFFKPKRSWPHDALASDFFAPGEWEDLRPEAGPWIQLVRGAKLDRVGAEIAHLRYDDAATLQAQARGWPVLQLAGAVGGVLRVFIETAPRQLMTSAFVDPAWREIPVFVRVGPAGTNPPLWPKSAHRRAGAENATGND